MDADTAYKDQLLADITKRRDEYNERRKQYKQKIKWCRNGLIGLVILPMTVVKRFHDCLLPTHDKVQLSRGQLQKVSMTIEK